MADMQQDRPGERKLGARLSRTFGTGEKHGYLRIYGQEYVKALNDVSGYAPPALFVGGAFGALVASLAGAGAGAIYAGFQDEFGAPETHIAQGAADKDHYSALQVGDEAYALFLKDGRYRLYRFVKQDKLEYVAETGKALDLSFEITGELQTLITALEKGERPGIGGLPSTQEFDGLTQAYRTAAGGIEREVGTMHAAKPGNMSYLEQMRAVQADWLAAKDQMINGHYGLDGQEIKTLETAPDVDSNPRTFALVTGGLVYGGLMLWPLGLAGATTASRVARSRRNARQNKR